MTNKFKELYSKDIDKNIEILDKTFTNEKTGKQTKLQLKYISWAFAVKVLKEEYPEAGYKHTLFNGVPYLKDEGGAYVGVELWLTKQDRKDGFIEYYIFPVLDSKMKSVVKPNSFQVNTAHQRCLSKLISIVTGLGLSIYTQEDINSLRQEYELENLEDLLKVIQLEIDKVNDISELEIIYNKYKPEFIENISYLNKIIAKKKTSMTPKDSKDTTKPTEPKEVKEKLENNKNNPISEKNDTTDPYVIHKIAFKNALRVDNYSMFVIALRDFAIKEPELMNDFKYLELTLHYAKNFGKDLYIDIVAELIKIKDKLGGNLKFDELIKKYSPEKK